MDREPEAWETSAGGPFLAAEGPNGAVSVWALGKERFRLTSEQGEQVIEGLDRAVRRAHELADGLGGITGEV